MNIAVLSGKGGTGKTLISVNLAQVAGKSTYIDCDVEEPNGHLFFKPKNMIQEDVRVEIPLVDNDLCNGCRKCVEFCKFNALAYIKDRLIIFEEICHSCGGCMLVCPEKALTGKYKTIGRIEKGKSGQVKVVSGIMNTGEASGVPIIDRLLDEIDGKEDIFIDCPPGSACTVMESIQDADYCVLVAEPTLFGAHNLKMVHDLVSLFNKPHGVVLNKCIGEENPSEDFCLDRDIKILGRIPFDHQLGRINSNAQIAAKDGGEYMGIFTSLLEELRREVGDNETTPNS